MPVICGQKKKKIDRTASFWIFLFSLLVASFCVNSAKANGISTSHGSLGFVSPDSNTKPPVVSISTPENNSLYAINDISLFIEVVAGKSSTASLEYISKIYYKTDWQADTTNIYPGGSADSTGLRTYFSKLSDYTQSNKSSLYSKLYI